MIVNTPKPPYVAVIFTNTHRDEVINGSEANPYIQTADAMVTLAAQQDGYLGMESARNKDGFGMTISYWRDEDSVKKWKANADHLQAQKAGRHKWYKNYKTRIATVSRDYGFNS